MKVRQSAYIVIIALILGLTILPGCRLAQSPYEEQIAEWRAQRYARLVRPMGWVSLAGLYEIEPGTQAFGSSEAYSIRFPAGSPQKLGDILLDSSGVTLTVDAGHDVRTEDQAVFRSGMIDPDDPQVLHWHALYWTFLTRGEKYYLRLWDTLSPARLNFPMIAAFPTDSTWRTNAQFRRAPDGQMIDLPDVLGNIRKQVVTGSLSGQVRGHSFELLALDEGDGSLFVIFEDATTDLQTYPAGRYLVVDIPEAGQDEVVIDFNRAYNPPCAYTAYATCLLAPPQNRLGFAVTAGEQYRHEELSKHH